ncbi:MAG: hypothetical protein LBP62_04320 [Clostridiales bacterium]|jgi:hypothetical protein|nr:hypothetical protein [Clostridiales bacterium]
MNKFFEWAYKTRGETVKNLADGVQISPEKMFLSFTSHNPVFVSHGSKGLNGAVKGVGFAPKPEFMEAAFKDYAEHIKTYSPNDKTYQERGLRVLIKHLYSENAEKNIDFSCFYGIEMAYKHSYANYIENPEASLVFYQPPMISYELRGKMKLAGEKYDADAEIDPFGLPLVQRFVNAQHDVYHAANPKIWQTRLVYKFTIEEIWNKSAGRDGFGKKLEL